MTFHFYPEVCCDQCAEIIHHHLDCPVCGKLNASSENYHTFDDDYIDQNGFYWLECECGARFKTQDFPYGSEVSWEINK